MLICCDMPVCGARYPRQYRRFRAVMKRLFGKKTEAKSTPERPRDDAAAREPKREVLPSSLKPIVVTAERYGIDHFGTPEGKNHLLSEMLGYMTEPSALL